DWFDYNANLKALLDEYNIVELLKNTLSPKLKENPKLKIDNVGDYKLSGKILDFSISDYTRDKNNNVIEKRYIMLLNIDILKSDSGRNIYTQPNV
ncbi:MAG TPA: hypothetical protein PLJ38_09060, partial [bacterium]|nr:hypothetical protein [bacterium]